jgi:alkylated DNA repair dioxygenase AlkB
MAVWILHGQVSRFTRTGGNRRPLRLAPILPAIRQVVAAARDRGEAVRWCVAPEPERALEQLVPPLAALAREGEIVRGLPDDPGPVVAMGELAAITALARTRDVCVVEDGVAAQGGQALRAGLGHLGARVRPATTVLSDWGAVVAGLGSGDSAIHYGLLPASSVSLLAAVREEVAWEAMRHRGGLVPRQVCVQASREGDRVPVYRHPTDEHPPTCGWTPVVDELRRRVEAVLGVPINHALIQRYPDRLANISLHADKTLDVARGSTIVNLSLGATRTMLLQHKQRGEDGQFPSQRVRMSHGSLFLLGWETNRQYRHGVRPDRRESHELLSDERAFDGERISLTFRTIASFLDGEGRVHGQGARTGPAMSSEDDAHAMLLAFGHENREAAPDWDALYGEGFDSLAIRQRS